MKTAVLLAVKLGLTIVLFAVALRTIDIADVLLHIGQLPADTLLLVVALVGVQMLISGLRLAAITRITAEPIPLISAVRINWIGSFFSQALVTFVSGDVVRAIILHRSYHIPMRNCAHSVTLDRLIGLLSSLLIVSATAPWAVALAGDESMRHSIVVLALIGGVMVIGFFMVGYVARHPAIAQAARARFKKYRIVYAILDTLAVVRHLFYGWRQVPMILFTSMMIQIINVALIFYLINGIGADVTIWQCLLVVPTVMLISLLPFSVAGWGLRESAMATGFSMIHVPVAVALAASLMFGILALLMSLPGGILWWTSKVRAVQAEHAPLPKHTTKGL